MSKVNLLDSLIENNSIILGVRANNWEEAVRAAIRPLVDSGSVKSSYAEKVIDSTKKFGPYYIISEQVAMPHGRPEDGVDKDAFSLVILDSPVTFDNDKRKIKVLIALAATSSDIHVGVALPQIVAVFESDENTQQIINAKSKDDIIEILKKVDFSKYIS